DHCADLPRPQWRSASCAWFAGSWNAAAGQGLYHRAAQCGCPCWMRLVSFLIFLVGATPPTGEDANRNRVITHATLGSMRTQCCPARLTLPSLASARSYNFRPQAVVTAEAEPNHLFVQGLKD